MLNTSLAQDQGASPSLGALQAGPISNLIDRAPGALDDFSDSGVRQLGRSRFSRRAVKPRLTLVGYKHPYEGNFQQGRIKAMRLVELNELFEQALRHAVQAEQNGLLGMAILLRQIAREIEQERQDVLASNPLSLKSEATVTQEASAAPVLRGKGEHRSAG